MRVLCRGEGDLTQRCGCPSRYHCSGDAQEYLAENAKRQQEAARREEGGNTASGGVTEGGNDNSMQAITQMDGGMLEGDEPDEENRSYSRISRPRTSEVTPRH